MGRIHYRYDDDLTGRVKACAAWKGQTIKEWIRRALLAEAERQETEKADEERRRRSR